MIHRYEHLNHEEDLVEIIDQYERVFPQINIPRLIALKLLSYHYEIEPLAFNSAELASYQAKLMAQAEQREQRIVVKSTPNNIKHPLNRLSGASDTTPDPMIQVAAGCFMN